MSKKGFIISVFLSLSMFIGTSAKLDALSGEEIIEKMEENTIFDTAKVQGAMIIEDRFGERTTTFTSYSQGSEKTLVEFNNPEDRGTKILRTEDEIYLFYPDAEELIRMQGAALRESVMGSDMSYEDMTGGKDLLLSYSVELEGEESVDGNPCFKITMIATRRNVPYYKQTLWVDKELFIYRRIHKFSRSGRLLKELDVNSVKQIGDFIVATEMTIRDTLKKNSSTKFQISEIDLNIPLEDDLFSLRELTW